MLGQLISEVSAQGAKERSFVYAGNEVMAIQSTADGQFVLWQHYDANRGSYRSTEPQGGVVELAEMDPMGADAGWMKPLIWPQPSSPGKLEPYYGVPELNSAFSGCVLDGVPVPCDMITNDNSTQCDGNHCGPELLEKIDAKTGKVIGHELSMPFAAWADGGSGRLPRDAVYTGRGRYSSPRFGEGRGRVNNRNHAGSLPQRPTPSPTPRELDCHGFADYVQMIADKSVSKVSFMDELARTFTGARNSGWREMLNNSAGASRVNTTDDGFKAELREVRDTHNQARHYVGGFIAGARLGEILGLKVMNDRETPGSPDYAPDTALNKISTSHGSDFIGSAQGVEFLRRYLARRIRIEVCGDEP